MKNKILLSMFVVIGMGLAHAGALPEKCPAVGDVIAGGLSTVNNEEGGGKWLAKQRSYYNTPQEWEVAVWLLDESISSADEAMKKAMLALNSLDFLYGPTPSGNNMTCAYTSDYNVMVMAATPPLDLPKELNN